MAKKKNKKQNFKANPYITDAAKAMRVLPVPAMIASINMQVEILKDRGVYIRDWDHKERVVERVQMIGNKAYILAPEVKEDKEVGK